MTLRQNKVAIRLGNFAFHGDDYGVVIKPEMTMESSLNGTKPLLGMCGRSSVYRAETS